MNYFNQNRMVCVVDESGNIYAVDITNNNQNLIGVVTDTYKTMEKVAIEGADEVERLRSELEAKNKESNEYFEMLVGAGLIERPKTQEEINRELMKKNEQLSQQLSEVMQYLKSLNGGHTNEHGKDT